MAENSASSAVTARRGALGELSEPIGRLACCEQRQERAMVVRPPFSKRQSPEQVEEFFRLQQESRMDYCRRSLNGPAAST